MGSLKKKKSLASANNLLDRWVGTEGDKAVASTGGGTWCGILVRLIEYLLADSTRTRRKKKLSVLLARARAPSIPMPVVEK